MLSFCILAPVALFVEGIRFTPSAMRAAGILNTHQVTKHILIAALCFHSYQQVPLAPAPDSPCANAPPCHGCVLQAAGGCLGSCTLNEGICLSSAKLQSRILWGKLGFVWKASRMQCLQEFFGLEYGEGSLATGGWNVARPASAANDAKCNEVWHDESSMVWRNTIAQVSRTTPRTSAEAQAAQSDDTGAARERMCACNECVCMQVSYMILQRVSPVTHSIGNCLKRVIVIVASVIVFQNPMSRQNMIGPPPPPPPPHHIPSVLLHKIHNRFRSLALQRRSLWPSRCACQRAGFKLTVSAQVHTSNARRGVC